MMFLFGRRCKKCGVISECTKVDGKYTSVAGWACSHRRGRDLVFFYRVCG